MPQSGQYNDDREIAFIADFPGVDRDQSWIAVQIEEGDVNITDDDGRELGVATLGEPVKIENEDGEIVDPATEETLEMLVSSLESEGEDSILIDSNSSLDVSSETVTVLQDEAVQIDQESEFDVSDSDTQDVLSDIQESMSTDETLSELLEALQSNDEDKLLVKHPGRVDIGSRSDRNLGYVDVEDINDSVEVEGSDSDSLYEEDLEGDSDIEMSLSAKGASRVKGKVESDNEYTVELSWRDEDGEEVFRDEVDSEVSGGEETSLNEDAISPDVGVIISDTSGDESEVNGVIHMM